MPLYLNDKKINSFTFPGGEQHLNIAEFSTEILYKTPLLTTYLYSSKDVMDLLLINSALSGAERSADCIISYLPYARQDRYCARGDPFSKRVFISLLDGMKNISFEIYDDHSTLGYLKSYPQFRQAELLYKAKDSINTFDRIVSPDEGAKQKAKLADVEIGDGKGNIVFAKKVRNPKTGEITETKLLKDYDLRNQSVLIIDDICDGGRTFIDLAKLLRVRGAKRIELWVTHGIFSKGLDALKPYIDHIYCHDTHLAFKYSSNGHKIDKDYLTITDEFLVKHIEEGQYEN